MNNLISALNYLNCAEMSYEEWIKVGMALKTEGCDPALWDEWSSRDAARYHAGECARHWKTFRGSSAPITGATVFRMARDRGWKPEREAEGAARPEAPEPARKGAEDLALYLETLFEPGDFVGYVTGDAWKGKNGKWSPGRGIFNRTAGELIAALRQCPDGPEPAVGKWKPEAGAWIRINPLDGQGVGNDHVARFRYALVESDEMAPEAQEAMYRKLELPIAALVHSGGRSVHAVVRVDAENPEEYRERVDYLYGFLAKHGVKVDRQNRNPSRLSRMPGVTRSGKEQKLLGVNLGRKSWADWVDFAECCGDCLPGVCPLSALAENPPDLPEELIAGVLRLGHKMLISGPSKAAKSFLLIELSIAIAEGTAWLGFRCRKGRVLYLNLEIDPASCVNRFLKIYRAMNLDPKHMDGILIWNLRGHAEPLDRLVPKLVRRARGMRLDAIIIDPIYKVIVGDENNASDMAAFCNQFDRICSETGCSVVYCHHHSKGAQGAKRAMDRASGSGVFARDPDAQLDIIELELSDGIRDRAEETGATAWRLESSLREFKNFTPVNFWFEYPVHRVDDCMCLAEMPTRGSVEAGWAKNKCRKTASRAEAEFRAAYHALDMEGVGVKVKDVAAYMGLAERTVRGRVQKMDGEFRLDHGMILKA